MLRTYDLRMKDVITLHDGRRLGSISDIEFDLEEGKITALVVPGTGKFFGLFTRGEDFVIPWDKIQKIGADVILVDLNTVSAVK